MPETALPEAPRGLNGFVGWKSAGDMEAEAEQARLDKIEETKKNQEEVVTNLAAYIKKCFVDAEMSRNQKITNELLQDQQQRKGEYKAETLAEIKKMGGTELFFNITETKCGAAAAWLQDVLLPSDDYPFTLEATPVPSLDDAELTSVVDSIGQRYPMGVPPEIPGEQVMQEALDLEGLRLRQKKKLAETKAKNMERKIRDQLSEGGFAAAFDEFIDYLCTYQIAIMKGPVVESRKRLVWNAGQIQEKQENILCWYAVNPHDFYPAPNALHVNDSYTCEVVPLGKSHISVMRDSPGWNKEAIDRVLEKSKGIGLHETPGTMSGESQRAEQENRDVMFNQGVSSDTLRGVEFWGDVQGCFLTEWGMKNISDANAFYGIRAILIGNEVVFAHLNPHLLGQKPYDVTSFERAPGSFYGKSIPRKMKDCQDAYNAAMRSMINNLAIASGPQVIVDMDLIREGENIGQIYPWRIWMFDGKMNLKNGKAVDFHDVPINSDELMKVAEYFSAQSDDRTLIPRYAHGNEDVGGAGQTASGLKQLMDAAAKGIKRLLRNIDMDILRPMIYRTYVWNMQNSEDESIKGDCQVVAKGALGLFTKETEQQRLQEFLNNTVNPVDMEIIGLKGRAKMLRALATRTGIPDDIVPSEEALAQMEQQKQMMMAMEQQAAAVAEGGDPNAQAA